MGEFAVSSEVGAKGLAWTKFEQDDTVQGGIAKFITDDIKEKVETAKKNNDKELWEI